MRTALSVVYLLTFFLECGSLTRYISHIQNYVNLVSAYDLYGFSTIDFPPLADASQTMDVNMDMNLYAVNGFDEVAGNIELVVAMNMSWLDEMSIIKSISFRIEDRAEFLVPFDMIWTPKIVLTNAIGASSDVGDSAYLCRFDMTTKRISWKPRVVVSGSCTPDVTYYPFDKQQCDFIYTAWGFKADEILILTNSDSWNLDEYDESGEWDIDSTSTDTYIQNEQSYIKFTIVMVRKPLYFAFNILLPILVLCLLNSTVFLLPAESGERVGFSVTCFLTFMVLLNMIMDIMPRSSNPISFLCYYLVVMMSNSGAMTLVTILLMRIYHKPEKSVVPKWLQRVVTFLNCGCAKLRCCVLCCRLFKCSCCCKDQRKCGCKNKKKKPVSEEMLIEIIVDKDQNVIEKPVKKMESKTSNDKEASKSSKCCCFISCVKHDDASNSKCCCGCILGCKKCKKNDQHTSKDSSNNETGSGSTCFSCFRKRKRQLDDDQDGVKCEDDSLCKKKIRTEINRFEDTSCLGGHTNKTCEDDESCKERVKAEVNKIEDISCSKKENADGSKSEIVLRSAGFGQKGKENKEPNKTERIQNGCFPYIEERPSTNTTNTEVKPEVNKIDDTSYSKKENTDGSKSEIVLRPAGFGQKGKENKELNKTERRQNGRFPYIEERPSTKTTNTEVKPEVNNIDDTSCSKKENGDGSKTETVLRPAGFGQKGKENKELNKIERRQNRCFPYTGERPSTKTTNTDENEIDREKTREKKKLEMNEGANTQCFRFMRKTKVSTLDITDTDIENDEMIVSTRSEGSNTLKVSFKGKDELDTEETVLQRWEDTTNSTTNKKGTSLNPIGLEEKNNDENTQNEDNENNEGADVTVKTKSIRNSVKEKEAKEREKSKLEKDDNESEIKIVRKNRSRRTSVKERLPKPVVHEKVNVALKTKSIRVPVKEKGAKEEEKSDPEKDITEFEMEIVRKDLTRRTSVEEKLQKPIVHEKVNVSQKQRSKDNNMYIDGENSDSEESEVDSLADLEEEVTWPEVGRILDTFFFLAFSGGQAFLTVVFLVPLFSGDNKSSET